MKLISTTATRTSSNNDKGGRHGGKFTPVNPLSTDNAKQAILILSGIKSGKGGGIQVIGGKINSLLSALDTKISIEDGDLKDPKQFIGQLADKVVANDVFRTKCGGYASHQPGILRNICINAIVAAIIAADKKDVVTVLQFVDTQTQFHEARQMAFQGTRTRNDISPASVNDTTLSQLMGGAKGMDTVVRISKETPIITTFFKPLTPMGYPTDMDGITTLAELTPIVRQQVLGVMDQKVLTAMKDSKEPRFGFSGKAIQKIAGQFVQNPINVRGDTDVTAASQTRTPGVAFNLDGNKTDGTVTKNGKHGDTPATSA